MKNIAVVSLEEARLFLDRVVEGPLHRARVWLNLDSMSQASVETRRRRLRLSEFVPQLPAAVSPQSSG